MTINQGAELGEDENRISRLEQRIAILETAGAVGAVHRDNVELRLTAIEDTLKWLVRVIIGAMILAVMGFAMSGGFRGV